MGRLYVPESGENLISLEDLTLMLEEVIQKIRNDKDNPLIKKEIEQLQIAYNNLKKVKNSKTNVRNRLIAYKQTIQLNLNIQKILVKLNERFKGIEIADTIGYTIVFNGKRYQKDKLTTTDVRIDSHNKLVLKATENALKAAQDKRWKKNKQLEILNDLVNDHLASYQNLIVNTYRGDKIIGKDAPFNYGNIAEAFENHLQQSYKDIYRALRESKTLTSEEFDSFSDTLNSLPKNDDKWTLEENATDGWKHLRASFGQLKGTVAGDAGPVQVKEALGDSGEWDNLQSYYDVIKTYNLFTNIFNNKGDIHKMAMSMAKTLTENVQKEALDFIEDLSDKDIFSQLPKYNIRNLSFNIKI